MMIDIKPATNIHTQHYCDKNRRYVIKNLISLASELPVQEMPLEHLNFCNLQPTIKSFREWVGHIKNVLDADLECPIILDDEGYVMDGRHRIAKAILEGKETIKFVRFKETPPPDYCEEGEP